MTIKTEPFTSEQIEEVQGTDPASDPASYPAPDPGDAPAVGVDRPDQPPASNRFADNRLADNREALDKVTQERDQLIDRLARVQAEFDNARKREARDRAEFRDFAAAGAIEQLLPVLDNFALALKSEGSADQLRQGVQLIVRQMEEALRAMGVQPVETVGVQFDPKIHEALVSVESNELPDQQVVEEVRRGYRLKDRLLRPALVKIASNPKQKEA